MIDQYPAIALPAEQVDEIGRGLREDLASHHEESEASEHSLTLRVERLTDERRKLLQLHYADAMPVELFKEEQERITRELEQARRMLTSVSFEFELIEWNLTRALTLARDCHRAYIDAPNNVSRHFNQAFFEKIHVRDDGEVRHELAEPFRTLLESGLAEKRPSSETTFSTEDLNENSRAQGAAEGSNVHSMVDRRGVEPLTSAVQRRRSPN